MNAKGLLILSAATFPLVTCASASAQDVQCTIRLEACGELGQELSPLTRIKEGVCLQTDIATIGRRPKGLNYSAFVWVGVSLSGNTLVLGSGEARTGIMLECTWNHQTPRPDQQMASLRASLPELLRDNRLRQHFPGIRTIDASKLRTIQRADNKCASALAQFATQQR